MRRSFGSISTSTSSASGSTSTPAARGVDAALRLGDRHPLHPVHAALVLQPGPDRSSGRRDRHRHGRRLVAAEVGRSCVEDLGLPALPLGVAQVHPQQVAGEQRRLVAALARLDLEDDVLAVVRVARAAAARAAAARRPRPASASWSASAANDASSAGEFLGGGQVAAQRVQLVGRGDDRRELGEAAAERAGPAWSACTAGSESSRSTSAYSARSVAPADVSNGMVTVLLELAIAVALDHDASIENGARRHTAGAGTDDGRRRGS